MPPRGHAPHRAALDISIRILDDFLEARGTTSDPGIPVLASLLAETNDPAAVVTAGRAVAAWARTVGRGPCHNGLYDGGLAGTLVGLRLGARIHPVLHRAADRLRDHLLDRASTRPWRTADVGLPDYDLISGPSGTLLALCAGTPQPTRGQLRPFAEHLAVLCDRGDLRRLRTGQYLGHPLLGWLQGRVNTGMGHGVAGLTAGLTAAVRRVGPRPRLLTPCVTPPTGWCGSPSTTPGPSGAGRAPGSTARRPPGHGPARRGATAPPASPGRCGTRPTRWGTG